MKTQDQVIEMIQFLQDKVRLLPNKEAFGEFNQYENQEYSWNEIISIGKSFQIWIIQLQDYLATGKTTSGAVHAWLENEFSVLNAYL